MAPIGRRQDDIRSAVQTHWILSALLPEPPADHCPEKYLPKWNTEPPETAAQRIMREIRETP